MDTRPICRRYTFLLHSFLLCQLPFYLLLFACLLASFLQFDRAFAQEPSPEIDAPPKELLTIESAGETWQNLPLNVRNKIDSRLIAELSGEIIPTHLGGELDPVAIPQTERQPIEQTRFLVHMQADDLLSQARHHIQQQRFANQIEQRAALFQTLVDKTQASQASVRTLLDAQKVEDNVSNYQSFYIVNAIAVDGNLSTLLQLALRDDVERISANYPLFSIDEISGRGQEVGTAKGPDETSLLSEQNWNIDLVDADRVWQELGIRGEGAVVSNFDTGVYYEHPALVNQYRGKVEGNRFDHNYSWFEPDSQLYPDGNLGSSVSSAPYDCASYSFHGTHTMGTMVGDGGANGTQIGMAPSARWIAVPGICYNTMSGGIQDDIGGLKAFQWLLCPTDLTGDLSTADCSKAPDVVNNSWGSANPTNDLFRPAIQALRAAGIAPVFASGNPSAGPGSIGSPANAPEAITVGATDDRDQIASFSGLGPSFFEGELKPELSAPGVNVLSAIGSGFFSDPYDSYSGTSMAAPHVAGLIALMISADLSDGVRDFNVDELERFIQETAVDLGEAGHDNRYGHGRIDAYQAVRWVLSAGDLQGNIIDKTTGLAVPNAIVTGSARNDQELFQSQVNPQGQYSITVPAATYEIIVDAWGYERSRFEEQTVFGGLLSVADFSLTPLSLTTVSGQVLDDAGNGIGEAIISIVDNESVQVETEADGAYQLALPTGTHKLTVERMGYRVQRLDIVIEENEAQERIQEIRLVSAPTILLVDSDAHYGHFDGWPVYNVFRWGLDTESYIYDFWRIQYPDVVDTGTLEDGSISYGIPSAETLSQYEVVIWIHSGCRRGSFGCFSGGSPKDIGAEAQLSAYLDGGGRLILSGQDIGYWDRNEDFFQNYLHAVYELDVAAAEGDTVTGSGFLDELNLKITNATLYGYRNGIMGLWPDAVSSDEGDGTAYPVLSYDNGNGAAALAVSPCTEPYRSVYFALGYESLGPRADERDPAVAAILDRSISWITQEKLDYEISLSTGKSAQVDEPGGRVTYEIALINTGRQPIHLQLQSEGNLWSTQLLSGTVEITEPLALAPCKKQRLTVQVDIPKTAENGESDLLTLSAEIVETGTVVESNPIRTSAFYPWVIESSSSGNYRYEAGAVALPNDPNFYLFGGWDYTSAATSRHERYNVCTGQWSNMAAMPNRRAGLGAATLNGKLYAAGGRTLEYDSASVFGDYELVYHQSLYIYDPVTDMWTSGADLPIPLAGMAAAVVHGKLYLFGGTNSDGTSEQTFEYDPVTNSWAEKGSMLNGGRRYISAATLNNKIYVAGGYPNLKDVDIYDPATDAWSTAGALTIGRWGAGMTAAPDGFLYLTGGVNRSNDLASAERYDPVADQWQEISALHDDNRTGSSALYAAGRVLTIGGSEAYNTVESLKVAHSFCYSNKAVSRLLVQPGEQITYTVELFPEQLYLPDAAFSDELPKFTTFKGFGINEIGVTYDEEARRLSWRGEIVPDVEPLRFTYALEIREKRITETLPADQSPEPWGAGDQIRNNARFSMTLVNGSTITFVDSIASTIVIPNLSPSSKSATQGLLEGEGVITYTIHLRSANFAGGPVAIRDPLPAALRYIPESLMYSNGAGQYNPQSHSIDWSGFALVAPDAYINTSDNYIWLDSAGQIDEAVDRDAGLEAPIFDWIDIQQSGTRITSGDDQYRCNEIGFSFPFYGQTETRFCADTNGFISFSFSGYSDYTNDCPLPTAASNEALIAAMWDDLIVRDGVYFQTFGVAPSRYLVVQWSDAIPYSSSSGTAPANFEIILYESGEIKIQILDAGGNKGQFSTTGLESYGATKGVTYACNTSNSLHDEQAIRFVPPGSGENARADIQFAMTIDGAVGANATVTNSVIITSLQQTFTRTVATVVNSLDLSSSTVTINSAQVSPNETVHYLFSLRNSGLLAAKGSSFSDTIPRGTTYIPDSLTCTGASCINNPTIDETGQISWTGEIKPQQAITLSYDVLVSTPLPNGTIVANEGQLQDGQGNQYPLKATFTIQRSDLGISFMRAQPTHVEPGKATIYTIFIRNSGHLAAAGELRVNLHPSLIYDDAVTCGTGSCRNESGSIYWSGAVGPRTVIPVIFRAVVAGDANYGDTFVSSAKLLEQEWSIEHNLDATVTVARNFYLPVLFSSEEQPRLFYLPMVTGQ